MTKNDRPLNLILIEDYLKEKNIIVGDIILKTDIVSWVENNYQGKKGKKPYARSTIYNWIRKMSTNDPGRLAWSRSIKSGLDDVFFVLDIKGAKKQIRLYKPNSDPAPIYKDHDIQGNIFDDIYDITSNNNIKNTSKETLIKSRLGQGKFREELIHIWHSCSVTGLAMVEILKASHIKPWAKSNNIERMDRYNGLLLTPNIDELFDKGFISFANSGKIIISNQIHKSEKKNLGISSCLKLRMVFPKNKKYLEYHRNNVLRK